MAGIGGKVSAKGGNDTVKGVLGSLKLYKSSGRLKLYGGFGKAYVKKTGSGDLQVGATIGTAKMRHYGDKGNVIVTGGILSLDLSRAGVDGNVTVKGLCGNVKVKNSVSGSGDISFSGGGGRVRLDRSGGSRGNVNFTGAAVFADLRNSSAKGNITVKGVLGCFSANRSGKGSGDINVYSASIANSIRHTALYGNVNYHGVGGANHIYLSGNSGNVNYYGAGVANIITHNAKSGDVRFYGTGGANVITRNVGRHQFGGVFFHGAGGANVITTGGKGAADVNFYGAGAVNVINHLSRYGSLNFFGAGGGNVITRRGRKGNLTFKGVGAGNIITMLVQQGDLEVRAIGKGNIINRTGNGRTYARLAAELNEITHVGDGHYEVYMGGMTNISVKKGNGFNKVTAIGSNNTHTSYGIGDAEYYMAGVFNAVNKFGNGNVSAIMLGAGNELWIEGNGDLQGIFLAAGNFITKRGDGDAAVIMAAGANAYTQTGKGDTTILAVGQGNLITKTGNGDSYVVSIAVQMTNLAVAANLIHHIGDGNVMGILFAAAEKFAGNEFTKVGDGDVALAMVSLTPDSVNSITNKGRQPCTANIATQIGNGRTYALMFGGYNIFTKIGGGDYRDGWDKWDNDKSDDMLAGGGGENKKSIADHVNAGMRDAAKEMGGLLANRKFNTIMIGAGSYNIFTEVNHKSALEYFDNTESVADIIGKKQTNTIMAGIAGSGNVMIKVGDGDFYGLAIARPLDILKYGKIAGISDNGGAIAKSLPDAKSPKSGNKSSGNIVVHVGHGDTNTIAVGSSNIVAKWGNGGFKAVTIGDNNIIARVGDGAGTKQAFGGDGGLTVGQGVQVAFGDRNVIFNHGDSNDIIVAVDPNMLLDKEKWKQIAKSLNPFPSITADDGDTEEDFYGRTYDKNEDPKGYEQAKQQNSFGLTTDYKNVQGLFTLFSDGLGETWNSVKENKKEQFEKDKKEGKHKIDTPEPYGNFVYGGAGSDIIMVVGTNNVVFSDSWTSLLDFNPEMLYNASGENETLSKLGSKLGEHGKLLGKRQAEIANIPGVGKALSALGINAKLEWVPGDDLGSLTGISGGANGVPQHDESDVGRAWAKQGIAAPVFDVKTPQIYKSYLGLFTNILEATSDESLSHSGGSYTKDGSAFLKGWKNGPSEFVSVIGLPEIVSSIKHRDANGKNIYQRIFGKNSKNGAGALWKNPASFWSGAGFLQNNGDLIAAIGLNNIIFTGEGSDMVLSVGEFNSITLGSGRDIALSWGGDNRIDAGIGNDFIVSMGAKNHILGGDGNDLLIALGETNKIYGGDGDNILVAIGDENIMVGGNGNDFIVAIGNSNWISGGAGDNLIIGIGVNNTYHMSDGNDVIINVGSASQHYLGGGRDIVYAAGKGSYFDAGNDDDVFFLNQDCENNLLEGKAGDDTFYLGGRDNTIRGGKNHDTFVIDHSVENNTVEDLNRQDRIVVDEGVDKNDIWFERKGDDLVIEIDNWDSAAGSKPPNAVGEVCFTGWFNSGNANQSNLYFGQEETAARELKAHDINRLVEAMANFTRADAAGNFQDNLTGAEKSQLANLWGTATTVDSFSVAA
ncbi:MAG: hypothetical protein GY761_16820 [Hyphomicrobiales bacterium]|nr:hypothetical protein [Hyphomicrobiales bacterium]